MKLKEVLILKHSDPILDESPASEKLESDIAKAVTEAGKKFGIKGLKGEKGGSSKLSDVKITGSLGNTWLEVKMNHTDNLSNPRVFFDGKKWKTTYKSPVAKFAIDELNKSAETKNFIKELKKFTGLKDLVLPTTRGGLKDPKAVPLEVLRDFVSKRGNRYILETPSVNMGDLVTQHYLRGKAEPAHYLQAADDFYLIGKKDPLKINKANKAKVPSLGGDGDFKVRISTRSAFYEIQTEVKIKNYRPNSSQFSLRSGTKKLNPFVGFSSVLEETEKNKIAKLDVEVLDDIKKVEDLIANVETKEAAKKVTIQGDLSLAGTQGEEIKGFPQILKVSGEIDASDSTLPGIDNMKSLEVGDSLVLCRAGGVTKLPSKLVVGGDLDIRGTLIKEIPKNAKIGGEIITDPGQINEGRLRKLIGLSLLEAGDDKTRSKVAAAFDKEMEFDDGRDGWEWKGRLKQREVLQLAAKATGDNKPEVIKNTASGDLYRFKGVDILFPKSSKKFVKIKLFNR